MTDDSLIKTVETIDTSPFRKMVMTIGELPTSFIESMTYYELLAWFCDYLQNTVIPTVNNNAEVSEELQAKFIELKGYVDNYFDNLDVQDEINNKLDGLVADGTLELLIGAYIQPRIDAQNLRIGSVETDVSTFEDTVNGTVSQLRAEIQSVASGSPLVASSTDDMTDTTKTYVNTTDGKWYYYDGDSWEIGGTYQAAGISDGTVTLDTLATDTKENLNYRINVKDMGRFSGDIPLDLTDNLVNKAVASGAVIGSDSNIRVSTPNLIYVPFGYTIQCSGTSGMVVNAYFFNEDFEYTTNSRQIQAETSKVFIYPRLWKYARLEFKYSNNGAIAPSDITSAVKIKLEKSCRLDNDNTIGTNLINTYTAQNGYLNSSAPYVLASSTSYKTCQPIKVKAGTQYYVNSLRLFALYDNDLNYISDSIVSSATTDYTVTPTQDGYAVVSYSTGVTPIMCEGSTGNYVPYTETLPAYVQLQNTSNLGGIIASKNNLTGKKYVALGDSFTHGDFSNAPEDNYHIESGTYAGQYKVYPYLIGNRNDMVIVNLAQNGMTMTKINNDWSNYISNGVLANIPADTDYITIKIGINDNPGHQDATLGTITDDRDDTFYGRFNRVMTYLITNFPDAKIGIIVSNGQTSLDFVNAAINIAKKYGVAYLNETTDDRVPLLIRTLRTDVADSIKSARNNHWFVSTTAGARNSHPNALCHEYESTIVEDFLRSL